MKAISSFIILMVLINFMHGQTNEKPEIIEPLYEGCEIKVKPGGSEVDTENSIIEVKSLIKVKKSKNGCSLKYSDWEELAIPKGNKMLDENKGIVIFYLLEPLQSNQLVKAILKGEKVKKESQIVKVKELSIKTPPLEIKKPLLEGNQVVEIYFQQGRLDKLKVNVLSCEVKEIDNIDEKKTKVTATLDYPLVAGQEVVVEGFKNKHMVLSTGKIVVGSSTLDWGFQRVFFNFGSILSKKKNEFSEADLYLDFDLHSHWTTHFISYAKFQFTSLPAQESNDGNSDDQQNDNNQENGNGVDQFIKSRKGVTFQVGMFFPDMLPFKFLKKSWDSPGYKNKIFAAPLIKAGFHTYVENIDNQDSQDDFFPFFSFGLRFGHLRVLKHQKTAPKLESYLDVTLGWSDNIGAVRDEEEDKQPYDRFNNTFNVYFEARLNIPKTPFILGFDAYLNWRKGRTRDDDEAVKVAVPDDLRFFIGTRIDITSIISKLIPGK